VRLSTNQATAVITRKMMSRLGMPTTVPLAIFWKLSGRPWMVLASVITSTTPRAIPSIPNVAMKGGSLNRVTSWPLMMPRTAPTAIPMSMASGMGKPPTSNWAVMAPDRARIEPTDRSIPPVRITKSWPIARMPKIETWRARLARLLPVRKSLLTSVRPPMATSNTTSAPLSRPAMSPRVRTRLRG